MKLQTTVRHGQISTDVLDRMNEKINKLASFHPRITCVELVVDMKQIERVTMELRVSVERQPDVVAGFTCTSAMGALDVILPKVVKQLRKLRERRTTKRPAPREDTIEAA